MGSDGQTFGFGLCLDAWQTLGVLFSYLNSVALALMLAGVLYKVLAPVRQDPHQKFGCRKKSNLDTFSTDPRVLWIHCDKSLILKLLLFNNKATICKLQPVFIGASFEQHTR